MKFSVFADLHYYPGVFLGGTYQDLDCILERAQKAGADFIIHAGDFCHAPHKGQDYINYYNNFPIKTYHALGNHDTDKTPLDETLKYYNMPNGYYYFDCNGYRMIVCDTNYYRVDGEDIHYSLGNYFKHEEFRDYMPKDQLSWLKESIESSHYPCILISHASFEREADGVKNQDEVRKIINEANNKRPHSVIMCINGHYHRDNIRILDNVCYFDLNSASHDWIEKTHDLYPKELCDEYRLLSHTVVYNDPIHAIVTVEGTAITIEGMESEMFMGITRKEADCELCDKAGRPVVPKVQSAKITLG